MENIIYATITVGVSMNFGIIKWVLFWAIAIPLSLLVGRYLFQAKREPSHKIISLSLFVLVASCLFPLIETQGARTSVIAFILSGSIPFLVMLLGFVVALVLLLTKNPNADYPSGIAYLIGFTALWIGFWQMFGGSVNDEVVLIYLLLPIIIIIFYIALYFAPLPAGKSRTGIWKTLDEWGTNAELLRYISKKYGLDYIPGSGLKQAEAKGSIRGYKINITGENWLIDGKDHEQVTKIQLTTNDKNLYPALITQKGLVSYQEDKLKFESIPLHSEYLNKYGRLPKSTIGKFQIYAAEGDRSNYVQLLTPFIKDLEGILDKSKETKRLSTTPAWIVFDENTIWYGKTYVTSPDITKVEFEKIIELLIKIAQKFDKS